MKRIYIAFIVLAMNTFFAQAQTQKVFKIDYRTVLQGQDIDKAEPNAEFTLRAWVNETFNRVTTSEEENGAQILNKKTQRSFILFPVSEEFHIMNEGIDSENAVDASEEEDLPIEFVAGKTKTIAGYPCKLAIINTDPESEDNESQIEIWYTEKIPVLYWGQFSFLKNVPGAALAITVGENGFVAFNIAQESVPASFFEIPESYTEYEIEEEEAAEADASISEDHQIDEDRYLYYDETENYLGLKDENDNIITKAEYTYFDYFRGGISTVINAESKYGAMDKNGNIKIPFKYDFLSYDDEYQQYIYAEDDKFGILSANDNPIIKAQYDMVSHMNQGYLTATMGEKTGILDSKGKIIVPISYPIIIEFNAEIFVTAEDDNYVLYSLKENKKLGGNYDLISLSEKDPIHLVQKGDKYGYINNQGKLVIPIKYTSATTFDDGHASVIESEDGDVFYINTKGEKVEIEEN